MKTVLFTNAVHGQPITTAKVGDTIVFDIPGLIEIWMIQQQNGKYQFKGRYPVPSLPYVLLPQDVGKYHGKAFTIQFGGPGALIAEWKFEVTEK